MGRSTGGGQLRRGERRGEEMGREEGNEGRVDKGFEQWLMTV